MVTVVTIYNGDQTMLLNMWYPLIHKHNEVEFILVHDELPKIPAVKNLRTHQGKVKDAVKKAKNKTVFITPLHCVPTYRLMTLLPLLGNRNECIRPKWYKFMDPTFEGEMSPAFSVLRDQYDGESVFAYIDKYQPTIRNKGEMYLVEKSA